MLRRVTEELVDALLRAERSERALAAPADAPRDDGGLGGRVEGVGAGTGTGVARAATAVGVVASADGIEDDDNARTATGVAGWLTVSATSAWGAVPLGAVAGEGEMEVVGAGEADEDGAGDDGTVGARWPMSSEGPLVEVVE